MTLQQNHFHSALAVAALLRSLDARLQIGGDLSEKLWGSAVTKRYRKRKRIKLYIGSANEWL